MEGQAAVFKDDAIYGISLSIQNLQHQAAEALSSSVTKYNPLFRNLLNYLDLIFSFGLKDGKRGYWPFVKKIAHSSIVEMVEGHKCATSDVKKGYIWLFLTFVESSLEGYIRMMVSNLKLLKLFYKSFALLNDMERCDFLLNLLVGLETLTFSIDFDDPYLDFGHDPVLRQEKVIIRVDSPAIKKKIQGGVKHSLPQQPDVTIHPPVQISATYPDLLEATQNLLVSLSAESSCRSDVDHGEKDFCINLVQNMSGSSGSPELEEDNYIPEIVGSPEYAVFVSEDEADALVTDEGFLQMSDVIGRNLSPRGSMSSSPDKQGYKSFLEDCKNNDGILGKETVKENDKANQTTESSTSGGSEEDEDKPTATPPIEYKIQNLDLSEGDGHCLTYVVENTSDTEDAQNVYKDEDDCENVEVTRSDSFDRFCGIGSTSSEDSSEEQTNRIGTLTEVTPQKISPVPSPSISKHNAARMSISRQSTTSGFLLPTFPRRPDLKEATQRNEEIILDQSAKILLSIELFSHPTELPVKMFKVRIGSLAGLNYIRHLLVSSMSIYLLEKIDAIHAGYVSMLSIDIDSIKKVQTSLNFQDVYVVHDNGCFHVSTADEIVTRSILLTIKSVIKSSSCVTVETEQPVADNTNNELEVIIKDWLICHTRIEEPQLIYFGLIQFSVLSPFEQRDRFLKSGYASCRHFLIAGVKTLWDNNAFFALRGHMLYKYTRSGNEVKNVYDLSKKCGGCVHSGTDGGRFTFKVLGRDGYSPLIELGVDRESEANEWLMTISQVVADTKSAPYRHHSAATTLLTCGLVMTYEKIYFFNQDAKSGRLELKDSCSVADISQVCIDNENRTYCAFILDHNIEACLESSQIRWLLQFHSEFELGKFEKLLYSCWESLYQVSLQFVLLSDITLKRKIDSLMNQQGRQDTQIGQHLLMELINN